jgi:hypothetical protein
MFGLVFGLRLFALYFWLNFGFFSLNKEALNLRTDAFYLILEKRSSCNRNGSFNLDVFQVNYCFIRIKKEEPEVLEVY